jgi:hypothetical protein
MINEISSSAALTHLRALLTSDFHDLGWWSCGCSQVLFGADDAIGV